MLTDLKQAGKKPVLNAGTKSGPGRGCSRMLGRGNFLDFYGKYPFPGKYHSGTQTSTLYHPFTLTQFLWPFIHHHIKNPNAYSWQVLGIHPIMIIFIKTYINKFLFEKELFSFNFVVVLIFCQQLKLQACFYGNCLQLSLIRPVSNSFQANRIG